MDRAVQLRNDLFIMFPRHPRTRRGLFGNRRIPFPIGPRNHALRASGIVDFSQARR